MRWLQPLSNIIDCYEKKYKSSQLPFLSSVHFSLIVSSAIPTSSHFNMRLVLEVNEIKGKYGNSNRLTSRRSFSQNNTPLSRIICRGTLV